MDFFNMLCNISGFFFVFNTNFSLLPLNLSENHRKDALKTVKGKTYGLAFQNGKLVRK